MTEEFILKSIKERKRQKEALEANIGSTKLLKESEELFSILIDENPVLKDILSSSKSNTEFLGILAELLESYFSGHSEAKKYFQSEHNGREAYEVLSWQDQAAIRLADYLSFEGKEFTDLNLRGKTIINRPFNQLWHAFTTGNSTATPDFFLDMIFLFRQFSGKLSRELPDKREVLTWMKRHPSGLDPEIIAIRRTNKERIIRTFIRKMDQGEINDKRFFFVPGLSPEEKYETALKWWNDRLFHLRFAVRKPELLNELLDNTLDQATMDILYEAKEAGIPFFINPYYLSLINVNEPEFAKNTDQVIRDYIIYSKQLINEFGHIVAWEKEDIVEPGKPNAAGWILPSDYNIHRRYPEVAILIPDTIGRACGGLCVSCQRMYDFQNGVLNFNLEKLKPKETWPKKLHRLMRYFEEDSHLRDILITGGDALMSSDKSIKRILDEVYETALAKIEKNKERPEGKKFAEMLRVRLGTRLPVYVPQRVTPELVQILAEFKEKASRIGMKQFVIQTHFETAMEITPEVRLAIKRLLSAGWIVMNQQVFTTAASKRGHSAKLRKELGKIGIIPYYTFSVKGYMENYHNFATNERAMQEQIEEKVIGNIPQEYYSVIKDFPLHAEDNVNNIASLKKELGIPFLATDRNVLNLPGVGKSLTFRTIGITSDGRRILEFDHDPNRNHSPIIEKMGKVVIIESKSIGAYLNQIYNMGEDIDEYISIFGYSLGETEIRIPITEYPDYDYELTDEVTNLEID